MVVRTAKRIKVDTLIHEKQSNIDRQVQSLIDIEGADIAEAIVQAKVRCLSALHATLHHKIDVSLAETMRIYFQVFPSSSREDNQSNDHPLLYFEKKLDRDSDCLRGLKHMAAALRD